MKSLRLIRLLKAQLENQTRLFNSSPDDSLNLTTLLPHYLVFLMNFSELQFETTALLSMFPLSEFHANHHLCDLFDLIFLAERKKIKSINLEVFQKLKKLKEVYLHSNVCINENFHGSTKIKEIP